MNIRLLYPDLRRPETGVLHELANRRFQARFAVEHGVGTLRCTGWTICPSAVASGLLKEYEWTTVGRVLGGIYAKRFGVPDVIHAHTLISAGTLAAQLARQWRVPWVFTEHSTEWLMTPSASTRRVTYARSASKTASAAISVSLALLGALVSYGLSSAPITGVLPNAVDVKYFAPDGDWNTSRNRKGFRFVYVGSVDRTRKRTDMLLRAFAGIAGRYADACLDIVGDGDVASLGSYADQLGIGRRVAWHGFLQRDALRSILRDSDALVHPSRWETFGVSVAEALAAGLPVVVSQSGGVDDIVTEDLCRLGCARIAVDDETGFIEAMARLVEAGPSPTEVRRQRSDIVRARYDLPVVGGAYARIYEAVLQAGRRGRAGGRS